MINGTAIPVRNMHKPGTTPEAEIKENIFKEASEFPFWSLCNCEDIILKIRK